MLYRNSLPLALIAASLVACGPTANLELKGIDLSTSRVDEKVYVSMEAIVVMGNLKFPNMEMPVTHPNTLQPIGQMTLQHLDDGSNRVVVKVDYEQAMRLDPTLGRTLPNGREIPISLGAENAALIGIRAIEQSRIYVGGDLKKDTFMGVAVAIPAFDNVLNSVPIPLNIFYRFPFSDEVSGVAGLFTGPTKGQNGIAIFAHRAVSAPASTPQILTNVSTQAKDETALIATNEIQKLNRVTLFRLNRLFNKKAIVKVK
jgi:hypothetical protein